MDENTTPAGELVDTIMEQAQVFASAWAMVGNWYGNDKCLEDAEAAKVALRDMVARALDVKDAEIAALTAERDALRKDAMRYRWPGCNCRAYGVKSARESSRSAGIEPIVSSFCGGRACGGSGDCGAAPDYQQLLPSTG